MNDDFRRGARHYWWASIDLDSNPLNRDPHQFPTSGPCTGGSKDCLAWDPQHSIAPRWTERALVLTALPAFVIGAAIVVGLGRLGVSQVRSFMISMPLLIAAWFYFVGWLLDRWRYRRYRRLA